MTTENKRYIVLPPETKPSTTHAKSITPTDETGNNVPLVGQHQGFSNFPVERQDFFDVEVSGENYDLTVTDTRTGSPTFGLKYRGQIFHVQLT